ncbi:CLUMA_CG006722, isoform A [Clunio marinus]|uniref:CLUMA_CG006722, isoform A n=1 Tax=Clunio marinus TaxID=568069 RepID=A0A1J1I064_9DIPT|nr:CLUMA_CG006722, isoform A [Clunio marinus]
MKLLIFFLLQVFTVSFTKEVVESENQGGKACYIGPIAYPPPEPKECFDENEIFTCAFGELRCDGLGYCGTPPCTWRCWCRSGYKRHQNGSCVRVCKFTADPVDHQNA